MERPVRKQPRLSQYDYNAVGVYFLTICTEHKQSLFGMGDHLTPDGRLVQQQLFSMADFYANMTLDKFVVMPNHIHLILMVQDSSPAGRGAVPRFVSALKRMTNKVAGKNLWQRSYYDHVIRNAADYLRVWQYIDENPVKWNQDTYYFET